MVGCTDSSIGFSFFSFYFFLPIGTPIYSFTHIVSTIASCRWLRLCRWHWQRVDWWTRHLNFTRSRSDICENWEGRVETNGTILTKSFRQVSLRSGQQYVLYDVYHFCVHASESLRVHIACTYFMVASCRIAEISLNREWTQTTLLDRVYFFFVIDFPNFLFFATSSELQRDMSCCQSLDTLNLSYRSRGKR